MLIKEVGRSGGEYNRKLKCVGWDKVILEAETANTERVVNGLILPSSIDKNERLHPYKITDVTSIIAERLGICVGDVVLVDMLARYYDTFPVSVVASDSIICKCSPEDVNDIHPLNNQMFVEQDITEEKVVNGFQILTDIVATGTIKEFNKTNAKRDCFNVGDRIFLTKCDVYLMHQGRKIFIYNSENVIGKIEDKR